MRPTIKDVARLSGVSVATVSRIVNGLPGYSPETMKKVTAVIKELGYTPNAVARNLVSRKSNTIGVLLPQLSSYFAARLLQGIEGEARKRGYSVIVCNTDSNGVRTMEYLNLLREKQVDGILFASEWLKEEYADALTSLGIPAAVIATVSTAPKIPYIKVDDQAASFSAVQYLIRRGHRKIGMISGTKDDPISGTPRIAGLKEALSEADLPFEEGLIEYGDFGYKSGYEAMKRLAERNPSMTAVFSASDEMALGVFSYCYEKGISVPGDLSVIGYDDTDIAMMSIPPLTAVHQPIQEMGKQAMKMVMELIGGGQAESVFMPYEITERDSVKNLH
ncbi:LacI family DNA-binding transcriptional regulator [Bacillus mangrovi]|uniref:LacI family DNA-binding transcriptional regulator n=1 Tax=Metabacillus mangrovi TaxID=1491830 RepID=A0A7X2S626_9BACI|nr:substrate-binding domain-containing protein [Metabacillus mangrovi]MTH53451.1 LacI family DNA-binding transcriptional regulator [Metabacillus mangrovi]